MNDITQIIRKDETVWLIPIGDAGYAIKRANRSQITLGETLKGPHYYTEDFDDAGELAALIVTDGVRWIFNDGEENES